MVSNAVKTDAAPGRRARRLPAAADRGENLPLRHFGIAVIGDDEADFRLIRRYLARSREYDFDCAHIGDFDRGVAAIRRKQFDLAVVDYRLGARSGLDLIRVAGGRLAPIPIILLTGRHSREADAAALDVGASDFLDKDELSPRLLERSVRYACVHHRTEHRLRASQRRMLRAKQQAEAANEAKSAFLAMVSHELRTPLNAIIGFSDILMNQRMGPLGSEKYIEYARGIHESGVHQLDVINDILDLSKIEAGAQDLHDTEVDLTRVIDDSVKLVAGWSDDSSVALETRIPPDLPRLRGDERKIRQILLNFLTNAVKFTPADGRIVVTAAVDAANALSVSVADTGIGILPDDLDRVMAPFGQADSAYVRTRQGTGLGLPLSKALAELHGGVLRLESAAGEGTTVSVRFPAARTIVPAPAPEPVG